MDSKEIKFGAILSYALVILNAAFGFLVTPYMISRLGTAEFGVYKTITALSTSLMVLDMGLGGTVMRYIATYNRDNENKKIDSFISMSFGEGSIIMAIIAVICTFVYFFIAKIYHEGLSVGEIQLAKNLFIVLSLNMIFHIAENILNGIVSGFNKFTFANGIKLIRIIARILLTYVLLAIFKNAMSLVLIDLFLTIMLIVLEVVYIYVKLHQKIGFSFRDWDMSVFRESFIYTILLFVTNIAAQINSNLDNVVVGAIKGSDAVTVYSMGLLIFSTFENLSISISGVMLPTVTNIIADDENYSKTQELIVKIGRIQFILLGACVCGFSIIGKDFLNLWLGDGYQDVYPIVLILMIPALLELIVNVCLSVLRAKNMLTFRTIVLVSTTILNAVVTIVGVRIYGYIAAAVGTALSFIIGSIIIMNIYYNKKLSFNMLKIYLGIFKGIWICLAVSSIVLIISSKFINSSWLALIINVLLFATTYGLSLIFVGLKDEEKKQIPIINKLLK